MKKGVSWLVIVGFVAGMITLSGSVAEGFAEENAHHKPYPPAIRPRYV
jgi:hypothetical protein